MKLDKIVNDLGLKVLTSPVDLSTIDVETGYCSDLLSCEIGRASCRERV